MPDLPIIADFSIAPLGIDLKDYRTRPPEDHQLAIKMAYADARRFARDDNLQTNIICAEDPSISEFRNAEFVKAQELGTVTNFGEFDALGLGVKDDYVPDARYSDQSLLVYKNHRLIGSFMLLKLRFRRPDNGVLVARATPWPAVRRIPGRPEIREGVIWARLMNYLLDNDLTLRRNPNVLDIIDWKFPVDRPELDLFRHSNTTGHSMHGVKVEVTNGRDSVMHSKSGIHKHIRRRGKAWEPDA